MRFLDLIRLRHEDIMETISDYEMEALERWINNFYNKIGIEVHLGMTHFRERINDARNGKEISLVEVANLFKKAFGRYNAILKKHYLDQSYGFQAVLKDMSTHLNIPFVLEWNHRSGELDLIAKTIMRKQNFHTPNEIFAVEAVDHTIEAKTLVESVRRDFSKRDPDEDFAMPYQSLKFGEISMTGWWLDGSRLSESYSDVGIGFVKSASIQSFKNRIHGKNRFIFIQVESKTAEDLERELCTEAGRQSVLESLTDFYSERA